jgi:hypothetical protein
MTLRSKKNVVSKTKLVMLLIASSIPLLGCSSNEEATSVGPHANGTGETVSRSFPPYALDPEGKTETVKVSVAEEQGQREFTLTSTQPQRDDKPQKRVVQEREDMPKVYSDNLMFDALFAQAVDDMRLISVSEIRDGSYNHGEAIPCECFETGEKWSYVWTRDLAYAADLALAYYDPQRVVNSLKFKTSEFRPSVEPPEQLPSDSLQIIQDTGSGGSWPVSTDRVTWAIAAETTIDSLTGPAREDFIDHAYAALRGTVEADRMAAFDERAGLYGGEQSYLDWRVQTYAPWIVNNLSRMSESKALSTNVAHYQALSLASRLARTKGDTALADKYQRWAADLKQSINDIFWLEDKGLYASLTTSAEDPAPVHKYDMLGTALAIQFDVAPADRARQAMANYPHAEFGVPVYYPHQPNMYVYHNRALWPYVTAYALRAGAKVQNPKVVDNAIQSLIRGAALNLSNMENLEWLTGKPWYDDGPAINSRRQLWSVAGYLSMVTEVVFGFQPEQDGIRISPFLTTGSRDLLGAGDAAKLTDLTYKGKKLAIELRLPESTDVEGYFPVESVTLNGEPVTGVIAADQLKQDGNTIVVHFGAAKATDAQITMAPQVDPLSHTAPAVFAPEAPQVLDITAENKHLTVHFADKRNAEFDDSQIHYNIYRDGEQVAQGINTFTWTDPQTLPLDRRYCYGVEAVFTSSGHRSHHSEPTCYTKNAVQVIPVTDPRVVSNREVTPASDKLAKPAIVEWGKPGDRLVVKDVRIDQPGVYAIQILYNNRQHTIDSGVTAAVKQAVLEDGSGKELTRGVVQMPNVEDRDDKYPLRKSTEFIVELKPGVYNLRLQDLFNMSYLESNRTYNGSGGISGPENSSTIAEFIVTRIGGQ